MKGLSKMLPKLKKAASFIKKTAVMILAAAALTFSVDYAVLAENNTTQSNTYLNDSYIGSITHKDIIKKIKAGNKAESVQKTNYIEEHAAKKHEKQEPQVDAVAIAVDGQPVVYVASSETAEDVVKKLKLTYVSEEQLDELEARKSVSNPVLPELKENESRILDVHFTKNISVKEDKTVASKILNAEDAVTYLERGTLEDRKYTVQEGDVLGDIANRNNLKLSDLLVLNPGIQEDSVLKIGQELNITVTVPFVEVAVEKEVSEKQTIAYQTEVKEDNSLPKGETKVQQEGQTGSKLVTYTISQQNGRTLKKVTQQDFIQAQPANKIIIKGTKVIPSRGQGHFTWPAVGGYISSKLGYRDGKMHKGIDIARPSDRTIKAADNGVVVSAGWDNGGYGNKVVIDHQNGLRTVYGHMASLCVHAGQQIEQGTAIGVMGATGDATGIHLHFEVYKNGALQNPLNYIVK
ncbi:peptidoglycan DD-metalloendopeptidase family protein [Neobacillus terrae]|uniref:peptidoglycan DD-metalloendopeptidase family protein n=1 Tax=Neobacillus terrae TaxID=3034837 RepID=UPI001FB120A9|nr:M23 family metallopeptidase [Neobacillus terrae]